MAKITGFHQRPRAPSMRGAFVVNEHRGVDRVSAWPKPRKGPPSQKFLDAQDRMRQASILAKYAVPQEQIAAREMSHGTHFFPRDVQFMALFGRLFSLYFVGGERRYSMASMIDISNLLDILGFRPGSMLYRGPEYWQVLEAPSEPRILGTLGTYPQWLTPSQAGAGGGSVGGLSLWGNPGGSTTQYDTKGTVIIPRANIAVSRLYIPGNRSTQVCTARGFIAPIEGTGVGDKLLDDPVWSVETINLGTDAETRVFSFADPVLLLSGQPYLLAMTKSPTTPNQGINLRLCATNNADYTINGPVDVIRASIQIDSANPVQGTPVDASGTGLYIAYFDGQVIG